MIIHVYMFILDKTYKINQNIVQHRENKSHFNQIPNMITTSCHGGLTVTPYGRNTGPSVKQNIGNQTNNPCRLTCCG